MHKATTRSIAKARAGGSTCACYAATQLGTCTCGGSSPAVSDLIINHPHRATSTACVSMLPQHHHQQQHRHRPQSTSHAYMHTAHQLRATPPSLSFLPPATSTFLPRSRPAGCNICMCPLTSTTITPNKHYQNKQTNTRHACTLKHAACWCVRDTRQ